MEDRELLKLAAKAAGLEVYVALGGGCWRNDGSKIWPKWNPLEDDGDALRLAMRIGFYECIPYIQAQLRAAGSQPQTCRNFAARVGIVRAAAEIERRAEIAAEQGKVKVTAAIGKTKEPKSAKVKREWPTNLVAAARAVFSSLGDDAAKIIMGECKEFEEVDSSILAELLMAIADIPRDEEPGEVVDDGQMDMLEAQA